MFIRTEYQKQKATNLIQDNAMKYASLAGIATFLILSLGFDFWTSVGLGFCAFIFAVYILRLGKTLPILELIVLISALQWVFGAHQAYLFDVKHFKYFMYVEREQYMGIVVPGLLAFALGLALLNPRYDFERINRSLGKLMAARPNYPVYLILIGFVAPIIGAYLPPAMRFIFFLLGNFKFIGAALWLFQPGSKRSWWATVLLMLLTFIGSVQSGMFHDLLLWGALMLSFVAYKVKFRIFTKVAFISAGFLLAFIIQSVKFEYREIIFEGNLSGRTKTDVFFSLVSDRLSRLGGLFSDEAYMSEMNVRLNQGWIISAIINNVPDNEPYANGETIVEAFKASALPRFLAPDKKLAGGRENFTRFTGLELLTTTSMGTSAIGEAYANFGKVGSWIFMFLWGLFISWGFSKLIQYGIKHPVMFVFIPLIFLQVIKAETETYVVLNHFVKSSILVFAFLWFARRFLKWQI